ncbi:MAG: hypothetical protein JWQ94_2622 [Tardiphaga sp.]|nr:hypothetical protein [Tardiphaga sp.]
MDRNIQGAGSAIAYTIAARHRQFHIRLAFSIVVAGIFTTFIVWSAILIWLSLFIAVQVLEFVLYRKVTDDSAISAAYRNGFFAFLLANNVIYGFLGLLVCGYGGSWGVLGACLLWSGTILNGAMVGGAAQVPISCTILPPMLHFLIVPVFVIRYGGTPGEGIAIMLLGLLTGVAATVIGRSYRQLLVGATRERETARAALLDTETGLPNRTALQLRADELTAIGSGVVAVAAIGIDRFMHLRGAIGHASMVQLIGRLANRFSNAFDGAPIMLLASGHLGLAFIARDMDEAFELAAGLQGAVTTPVRLRDTRVDVSITVGLSEAADALHYAADLAIIDRALIAVSQARAARRHIARFDAALYGNPGATLSLMSEMSRALHNGQMALAYQPKYDLRSGAIVGAEALARWTHPDRGALRPDLFVGIAEETGHIAELTKWVLRRAIGDQRQLLAAGFDISISVNWSGHLLDDVAFTDAALEIARDASGRLCLEVTETAIIGNAGLARQTLERFRAAGLTISIDDYGSGLSSLAYLKNIPADELKIDKAFVTNMATDPVDAVLVRAAVSLAHSLGLLVVAEGVEQQAALELLRAMGCDLAQGYLIARPMPLPDLVAYLAGRTNSTTSTMGTD